MTESLFDQMGLGPDQTASDLSKLHDAAMSRMDQARQHALSVTAPFQAHSPTSRSAAASMTGKTGSLRRLVFDLLAENPMTDEELISASSMSPNTIRPRRVELVRDGLVVKCGLRVGKSGRPSAVWKVVE